jgi:phosphate transport system protein
MLRKSFHDELEELQRDVLMMGKIARQAIENAVNVVVDCDVELAEEVIDMDDRIDQLNYQIEEHAMEIIARQAPVASDLRFCWTIMFIALHLERIGDLAVNMAKGAKRSCPIDGMIAPVAKSINEMGQETLHIVDLCLQAFEQRDVELARTLTSMDDVVDRMHRNMFEQLSQYRGNESMQWIGSILLASRFLERVADHCVDISERIDYLVTGQIPDGSQA